MLYAAGALVVMGAIWWACKWDEKHLLPKQEDMVRWREDEDEQN